MRTIDTEKNFNKEYLMRNILIVLSMMVVFPVMADEYLGQLSENPYNPDSTSNEYGQHGSKYSGSSINNPYGRYGSQYSNESATNTYATNSPKLYDSDGNYRGKLSTNKYDPDSVSNPYGRYGSEHSSDSINNPYGAGRPYRQDSPNNRYGEGLSIYGDDDG
jgi:hypothetical protein